MKSGKWRITAFWGALTLALDLAAKYLALSYISPWEPVEVIPGFFNLVLTYNPGAAFSILADCGPEGCSASQGLKMAALASVSLLPFLYFYVKAQPGQRRLLAALGLIWGGALGNIHDRLRWGKVVDFLDIYVGTAHWPAFNVADIAICAGAALLVLHVYFEPKSLRKRETAT